MGPFQFETYHNPYVQSISQLMLAPAQAQAQAATTIGEAQARAAQQQGQAWSGALNNIAQTVSQLPQQIARVKQEGTINQLNELKLKEQQTAIADHDTFKKILKDTPQIQENGMDLWDLPALGQKSVAAGIDPSSYLAEYGKVNEAFRAESSARQATVQTAAQALAKAPDPDLALNFIDMASRNRTIDGQTAEHLKGMIDAAETPQAKAAVVQKIALTYAGQQKPLILSGAARPGGAPQTAIDPLTGNTIATGATAGPAQPTPASIAMDAAGGDPVKANQLLRAPTKMDLQAKPDMVIKGTTNVPSFDPSSGKYMFNGAEVPADQVVRAAPPKDPVAVALQNIALQTAQQNLSDKQKRNANVAAISEGMKNGTIPPDPEGLSRQGIYADVVGQMAKDGVNFEELRKNWLATKRLVVTENSPQSNRLDTAVRSGLKMYDAIDTLSDQWQGMGLGPLSRANLKLAMEGGKGREAANLAIQLNGQIAQLTSDVATVEQNGMTPTQESRHVAEQSMQSWWGNDTIHAMTAQGRANMKIREAARNESVPLAPGQTAPSVGLVPTGRYNPATGKVEPIVKQ